MPRLAVHSIRWRVGLPYIALILLVMLGLGSYLSSFMRQTYLKNVEERLSAEARLAAENLIPYLQTGRDPQILDSLAKQWGRSLGTRVTIIGADGVVLGESDEDRLAMENHATRPEIVQARSSGVGQATRYSETTGYTMMYMAVAVVSKGQVTGYARIALPLQQVDANIAAVQRAVLGAALLAAILAAILSAWIASRTTQPLRDLTQAARQMSAGRLDTRLIPRSQDEVGELTTAFNHMAVELHAQIIDLETERSRLAAVLQVMTDGVLIVDGEGKIQLVNQAAQSMFEIHASEVMGHSLMTALRHHQIAELWQHSIESGESISDTFEIAHKHLYLQCIVTPLGKALPDHTLMLFQNLTRLRRLETVRQDFISNISHELRTPLASLKALTETLQDGALDDPPAAQRFLMRIETEVDALTQMVEELLELSRIESGRVPLKMTPTPPCDLLRAALERLTLQAERAELTVQTDCPLALPPVLADQRRLEQVLVNLLHNAIKFTPPGGTIWLRARSQNDQILFSVQDTGVGISAQDLPRIFERFYKTDRARSSRGTGLGLAIARHLVEAHKGKIWAESEERQGSTFYFTIPTA